MPTGRVIMPDIAALVQDHGYWVLALVVMLENAGLPVPGETALLAAGYLTSPDGGRYLHVWVVAGPAAGASGMRWDRFLLANAAGALCWAVVIALVGHYAGHAWEAMRHWLGPTAWIVLAAGALLFMTWRVVVYWRKGSVPDPHSSA